MADVSTLLKEADDLGILNIEVDGAQLTPDVIQTAIDATKRLNSNLNKETIFKKLQEADRVLAAHYR